MLGKPAFYAGRGSFSLWATQWRPVGVGELLARIERLRVALAAEGLFDARLKRPLPFLPRRIGLITGLVAHKIFQLSREKERKVPLAVATVISAAAGMAFNIVADPLVGYFYKMYVLGMPQDAATILAKMSAVTTSVNAVIAVIAATIFYLALRPALKKINKLPQL